MKCAACAAQTAGLLRVTVAPTGGALRQLSQPPTTSAHISTVAYRFPPLRSFSLVTNVS